MDDDIEPGASIPQSGEFEGKPTGGKWKRWIYTDEVFWRYNTDAVPYVGYHNIAQFPFVPGFFVCRVLEDHVDGAGDIECHWPVAGPFPTLKSAKAAVLLLGETDN